MYGIRKQNEVTLANIDRLLLYRVSFFFKNAQSSGKRDVSNPGISFKAFL
ncbi:hypothetical protein LCGC14_0753930 [marine sediment metagenome]|uniref:Uncharacterized protein n=1 Tax=marine sediment metagenome TaxID=412755 RepID=A0A0F9TA72_9ZZZZ